MPPELTARQRRLLEYLEHEVTRRGTVPSLRRAGMDLGISHTAVAQMIKTLEQKGALKRQERYSRTVHLLNRSRETAGAMRWQEVPIVGRIAAGLPLYAQQEWDGTVVVDSALFRGTSLFALRVEGDSMIDAAILNGDLAICEPRQYAADGEIVVALVRQEEATVKRFFRRKNHIELRPENPAYPVMTYEFAEVLIQGKVIGIHRGPEGIDSMSKF